MRQSAADASRSILDFCKEQPLISAGLGLALGAAIGAALPSTRKENQLMGEASDRLKERAQALAEEQYEKTRAAAEHAYEGAQQEVKNQSSVLASELAEATQETLTTVPALPEEAAS